MRLIFTLVLLLNSNLLFAQMGFQNPAFVAGLSYRPPAASGGSDPYVPTNMVGYPAVAWYDTHQSVYSNGSTMILPDKCGFYNLTNSGAVTVKPVLTNNVETGRQTLWWGGGTYRYLRNSPYTNWQGSEIVLLVRPYSVGGGTEYFFDSADIGRRQLAYRTSTPGMKYTLNAGVSLNGPDTVTNKWIVLDFVFKGSSSAIYTNGVQVVTGDGGTQVASGFTLGNSYGAGSLNYLEIAEVVIYGKGGALPGTNATARANLYNYFKNKYPGASLP